MILHNIDSIELLKSESESERQYIWRIGNLFDSDLICHSDGSLVTWSDVSDLLNKQLRDEDTEQAESSWRKPYKYAKQYYEDVFSKMDGKDYSNDLDEKIQELQKEKYKLFDNRNAYNKLLRERARQEELNEIIINSANNINLPKFEYNPINKICFNENTLLCSLNDLHIGSDINNFFNIYNSDICRERLYEYAEKIRLISELHKSEDCVVWCNGDEISGNIHQSIAITNKENVVQQVMIASELISEFLSNISKYFKKVRFVSVAGNHSRLGAKEDSLKDERLDDLIEWWLKARLQNQSNIIFDDYEKIDSTIYLIDIRGKNYLGVHGDYDGSLNKIQALQMMTKKDIYAVLMGHLHHNRIDCVQGIKTIMAGSFLGIDDFCISKRIYGNPEQLISIADDTGIICNYDIRFSK